MEKKLVRFMGLIIATVIFVVQLMLIPNAGLTWDEPSSFFFGRANLLFWFSGDRGYLTDLRSPTRFVNQPFPYIYGEDLYPPFPFVVQSAFSYIFSEKLGLLPVIDAHHLGEVFIGAIGVWAMYGILTSIGIHSIIAVGTTILYALYPTIFGQMRSDAKDIPLMSTLVIFVYVFLRFIQSLDSKSFRVHSMWALFCGISLGLAFATKPTAPIILLPLGIWFLATRPKPKILQKFIPLALLSGAVSLFVFFIAWPWLWDDPIGKIGEIWRFFSTVGFHLPVQYFGSTHYTGYNLPLIYPIVILLIQTPLTLIALAVVGMYRVIRLFFSKKDIFGILFLIWFIVGIGRFFLPGVVIYAKIRHFIDAMPAFFVLVAYGTSALIKKKVYFILLFCILIIHEVVISIVYFPYEPSYFNMLVGGAKNVTQTRLFDAEYWGSSIAEGMEWIKKQSGQKTVYACGLKHLAYFYKDPTIIIHDVPTTGDYVLVPNSYSWFGGPMNVYGEAQKPVHTVTRAGADLLYIYRITSATWWCGYETDATYPG